MFSICTQTLLGFEVNLLVLIYGRYWRGCVNQRVIQFSKCLKQGQPVSMSMKEAKIGNIKRVKGFTQESVGQQPYGAWCFLKLLIHWNYIYIYCPLIWCLFKSFWYFICKIIPCFSVETQFWKAHHCAVCITVNWLEVAYFNTGWHLILFTIDNTKLDILSQIDGAKTSVTDLKKVTINNDYGLAMPFS